MSAGSINLQKLGSIVSSAIGRDSRIINRLRPAYESALAWTYGEQGIPWLINGVPVRIDPRYRHLMGQSWDPEVASFLRARVKPGSMCLNVGANAGVYVLQFCHWSGPDGRVVAFEPNPITREILLRHVRMNGFESRVEVVPFAISDRKGAADFHFTGSSGMSRLGEANSILRPVDQVATVETTTLDAFCGERDLKPDWLLMDIEGYELPALRGAERLISKCGPAMVVEMHPPFWPNIGVERHSWHDFLSTHGLHMSALMGQRDPLKDAGSVFLGRAELT